jgi:glutathionylspermidine synthase
MERVTTQPRDNWQQTVASQGLYYHTVPSEQPTGDPGYWNPEGGRLYWDESVYYRFTAEEIDAIEQCTASLNQYCLKAVEHIIAHKLFNRVGIPDSHVAWVERSWERDEHTIYGRFDLCYDGHGAPRLLEYNADTPTALLEAAVIQWYWLKDCHDPDRCDQYNSIHERLLEIFGILRGCHEGRFHFAALAGNLEDFMTVNYLRDVAMQAGWDTRYVHVEDIGWHEGRRQFTDLEETAIRLCFKLYPWEWLIGEQFGANLLLDTTRWWEPPWKMLLSNKGILPILYELFPDSPYLLPASSEPLPETQQVSKPLHGREGANLAVLDEAGAVVRTTPGPYAGPYVYQQYCPLPNFDGCYPVVGSWLVNGYACGIGIREDTDAITTNGSRFVPHLFLKPA